MFYILTVFYSKAAIKFLTNFPLLSLYLCSVTRNTKKKKKPESIKQELFASIIEIASEERLFRDEGGGKKNAKEPKDDPIFLSRYVCINFCVNFLYWKNQLYLLAIIRVILSWSKKCVR